MGSELLASLISWTLGLALIAAVISLAVFIIIYFLCETRKYWRNSRR